MALAAIGASRFGGAVKGLICLAFVGFVGAFFFSDSSHTRFPADLKLEQIFSDQNARMLADAAAKGDIKRITSLIEAGTDVNHRGKVGISPLWWAVRSNNYRGVVGLFKHGADPNLIIEGDRQSIVESAAMMKDNRILQAVLANKGHPDLASVGSNRSPIFWTIISDRSTNLQILIEAGANLNHTDGIGATAAMNAAIVRDYKKALLLLHHGTDPTIQDRLGRTLKSIVMARGEHDQYAEEILRLLADQPTDKP